MTKVFLRAFVLSLLLLGPVTLAPAQLTTREHQRSSPAILAAFHDAIAGPLKSVVRVLADGKDVSLGTVVSADGYILAHRSDLGGKIVCKFRDGTTLDARVVGVDEAHWLTMLKVDAKDLTPVEWKSSKKAEVGDWVAAPGMRETPIAVGVIGVAARKIPGARPGPTVGPGVGGYLGVVLADVEHEVTIEDVQPGQPAARGGIKAGDVLLSIDGSDLDSLDALKATLGKKKPGDTVAVRVRRDGAEKTLKVTLGRWPNNPFNRGRNMNAFGSKLSDRTSGFPNILQHDGVIDPTDCGGPLVDLDGKAVGINVSRAGRTETYAIPSDIVLALMDDLKSGKLAPKVEKAKQE